MNGEDEFDAVTGLLAMIGVISGAFPAGEPSHDPAITTIEGWILGRSQAPSLVWDTAGRVVPQSGTHSYSRPVLPGGGSLRS